MAAVFAFLGMLLLSMVVALLAVLQLGDFFDANDEFILVIAGVMAFTLVSQAVFALAYAMARHASILAVVAILLAVLALVPAALPAMVEKIADRSTNPGTVGVENTYIAIELIVPAIMAVLVQWGLTRRRWLRTRGTDDLGRWPWISSGVAGLVILNPLGLTFLGSTLRHSPTDLLWDLTATVTAGGLCALLVAIWVECYIRDRMLGRRAASAVTPAVSQPLR